MSDAYVTQLGRSFRTRHRSAPPLSVVNELSVEDGASDRLYIQRQPCPECLSRRTIQTDVTATTESLYCPDCGCRWERVVPPGRAG
jgi:hypothetical protein